MNQVVDKKNAITEVIARRMNQLHDYHNHKETMAHAAVLVNLGLAGGICIMDKWPPSWLSQYILCNINLASIGIVIIWFWIHVYMRFQLIHRRMAAIYVGSATVILRKWCYNSPTDGDLDPSGEKLSSSSFIVRVLNKLLIPIASAGIHIDEEWGEYPKVFLNELRKQSQSTGALQLEKLVTYGSIFLVIIMIMRITS